jgi:hypothetical protein
MAPDFEDRETGKLAAEVARLAGESEGEAVREALRERRDRLRPGVSRRRPKSKQELLRFMETEIWPLIPVERRGGPAITKAEKEEILGYGPEGF